MQDIVLFRKDRLVLLDQRKIPHKIKYLKFKNPKETAWAISEMVVRGAPAIGIAAAYGYALGCNEKKYNDYAGLKAHMEKVREILIESRPTAVNLKWAVDKMHNVFLSLENSDIFYIDIFKRLVDEANSIKISEIDANKKIGEYGTEELKKIGSEKGKLTILTHCNAGALATGGWGTALGVIRSAFNDNIIEKVYVDETRPRLQGARLTCFELKQEGIPYTLICDNMSGFIMTKNKIDAVIVGADRIAANGDAANKIGTYMAAVLAKRHGIPFYVAAPVSTFDFNTSDGKDIEIELRSENEVLSVLGGKRIAPEDTVTENYAFDVTPHELIEAYITEKGVIHSPDELQ
jgi:methylthioribose-1-phosphate isomerase